MVALSAAEVTCASQGLAWLRRWGQEESPTAAVMPVSTSACATGSRKQLMDGPSSGTDHQALQAAVVLLCGEGP